MNSFAGITGFRLDRLRRLSREGSWVIIGYGVSTAGALAGIRLLTELLQPREYGELALAMTLAMLINQAVFGPLSQGAMRFYAPAIERGDFGGYRKTMRRLAGLATAVVLGAAGIAALALTIEGESRWFGLLVGGVVYAIFAGCASILSAIQIAARQRAIVAVYQGFEPWARALLAASLVLAVDGSAAAATAGYATAAGLSLASQYWFFQRRMAHSAPMIGAEWQAQIWGYSWPIAAFGVFTWGHAMSDRWALEAYAGTDTVGLYAALFQVGYYPIVVLGGIAVQFLAPIYFQRAGDARDSQRNARIKSLTWRLTSMMLGCTTGAVTIAWLFHAEIFRLLVAAQYGAVSSLLPWMVLAGGLAAAAQGVTLGLMTILKTYDMMLAKISTALFGILCNFAGAYWFGIEGVAAAGVLFGCAALGWMVLLLKHRK